MTSIIIPTLLIGIQYLLDKYIVIQISLFTNKECTIHTKQYNMIDFFKLDDLHETKQMFINCGKRGWGTEKQMDANEYNTHFATIIH